MLKFKKKTQSQETKQASKLDSDFGNKEFKINILKALMENVKKNNMRNQIVHLIRKMKTLGKSQNAINKTNMMNAFDRLIGKLGTA